MSWWWLLLLLLLLLLVLLLLLLLLMLLLLLLLHGVLLAHTRAARARAPNTPANTDSFGARPHIYGREVREPTNEPKNHGIYDVFAASEKIKLKIRIAKKKQKHCILRCFWPAGFGPPGAKTRVQKSPKTSLFTVFWAPTEEKTALRAMFSHSRNPKMKPKQRYSRCFCNSEKGVFAECRKTKSNIRMAKIQKRCILRCFFSFRCEKFCFEKRSKHRNLQCFLLPPKTKQRYLRCFPSLASPK